MGIIDNLNNEPVLIKTSYFLIAGMAIVCGNSVFDVTKKIIDKHFTVPKDQIFASIVYTIVMIAILILMIAILPDQNTELPHDVQAKLMLAEYEKQKQNSKLN